MKRFYLFVLRCLLAGIDGGFGSIIGHGRAMVLLSMGSKSVHEHRRINVRALVLDHHEMLAVR